MWSFPGGFVPLQRRILRLWFTLEIPRALPGLLRAYDFQRHTWHNIYVVELRIGDAGEHLLPARTF